jgi:ribose-phosphate pyrophosphokinase
MPIHVDDEKSLKVFAGRSVPALAQEIAEQLGTELTPTTIRDFASGEIYVRYNESVRGSHAFLIQSASPPVNEWMMETLLMVDALKRGSAKRITVVLPFYPYARQDKKHKGREPISARLIADLLKTAGAHRILTVDLHSSQIQGFFDGPVDHLYAMDILTRHIAERHSAAELTIIAPDAGRVKVAERWANTLGGRPLAIIHKTRDPNVPNQVTANRIVGEVKGRVCVVVDDMIDTAGTIATAAEVLYEAGAADVVVAATHPVLSDPAIERLEASRISEIIVTNTVPLTPEAAKLEKITVLSIAPLIARAVWEVFNDGSVTNLFDGEA